MDPIARCIRAARLWLLVQNALTWLGRLSLVGLAIAAGLLLADRLLGVRIGWANDWGIYVLLAAAVVLAAGVLAWRQLPGRADVAALIDHRLGLKDTISTALYAGKLPDRDGFAQQVIEQGRQQARHLKVRQAFPVRPGWSWAGVLPGGLAVAAVALYLPVLDLLSEQSPASSWTSTQTQQQTEQTIARVADWAGEREAMQEGEDPLAVLKRLTAEDLTAPVRQAEALEQLSRAQDQLANQAARQRQQAQAIANMLSRIEPTTTGPADDLADALRRSDLDAAAEAARQLGQQIEQMTPQQRQQLAEQLEDMAQQFQQQAQQQTQRHQQAQQTARQALEQAGMSPQQIDQMTDSSGQIDPQQVREALEQQAQSPAQQDQAQQAAKQVQQQQQESQVARESARSADGLGQSMRRMSQAAQNQGDPKPDQDGQQPDPSASDASDSPSFEQAAEQTAQELSEMAQRQGQPQSTQQAQRQVQQMMQQIADSSQPGGREAGSGQSPFNAQPPGQPSDGYKVDPQRVRSTPASGDAPMMGTWVQDDRVQPGEAAVQYQAAAREARQQAEQAVSQQRVPRQYHSPIKRYFDQLPQAEEAEGG